MTDERSCIKCHHEAGGKCYRVWRDTTPSDPGADRAYPPVLVRRRQALGAAGR